MKAFTCVALLLCLGATIRADDYCHTDVENACSSSSKPFSESRNCNSRYGGIEHVEADMQAYINHQLNKSYEYLLLGTYFGLYTANRPGFNSLYQKMSDKAFDDAIDMIKHLTRRGGKADFNAVHKSGKNLRIDADITSTLEVSELHSLAIALDNEKNLSNHAFHVHSQASHAVVQQRDPEIAHYFEEKVLAPQAETIRKLSGYANDLAKMLNNNNDRSLALYLFDQYLQKQ